MEYRENINNSVILCGTIKKEFELSHELYGESFYQSILMVERLSGRTDMIPIMVSERLVNINNRWLGMTVAIEGEMRSYNQWEGEKSHLLLHVFAKYFSPCEAEAFPDNSIHLYGCLCKEAHYRETPLGREIADVLLAVNRPYGKSDYIPCIFWGRNARYATELSVGQYIRISGRVQSREFKKRISETEYEQRTAYEVSISSLEVISDVEAQNS